MKSKFGKGHGNQMSERIGKIELDDTFYPGEDLYCDGAIEDELLAIAKQYSQEEYGRIIEERADWPVLYHLSPLRANIIDWIPMTGSEKVLEVGSGCGAITGRLSQKAGSVTCIDLSMKRSKINAYRNQYCDNIKIHVGNFIDIERELDKDFDYIYLIGVFEYGQSYMGTKEPFTDFIRMMSAHLKPGGRIIIAIENRLGLKYFAGCKEDHLGSYFSGIEDYAQGGGVRTFSRNRLEEIFKVSGLKEYSFYYPYPDYKFMTALYSDDRLPKPGELTENMRNFDRDRMLLFDEKQAFDGIIKDCVFPVFSNSYIAVIGEGFDVKYAKYSNDRTEEYAVRTEICIDQLGNKTVKKYALTEKAKGHINSMYTAYIGLSERYAGGRLAINKCRINEDKSEAEFEFLTGTTLEELFDRCLKEDDQEGFCELFREYVERISYHEELPISDYDLIFSNIIVSGDTWTVIDYEWTYARPIPSSEIAFRAYYCYILENEKRNKPDSDFVLRLLGITEAGAEAYKEKEMEFQKIVTGNRKSMAELREMIGYRVMEPAKWVHKFDDSGEKERIQVYEDRGNGYREEDSYFVKDAFEGDHEIRLRLKVDGSVSMLRIDPAMDYCAVRILHLLFNGKEITPDKKNVVTNGKAMKDGSYVFATDDPNINFKMSHWNRQEENSVDVTMEVIRLSAQIASDMAGSVKKIV